MAVCSVVIGSIAGLLGNYLVGGFRRSLLIGFIALVVIWAILEGIRAMTTSSTHRKTARAKQVLGVVAGEAIGADGLPEETDVTVEQSAVRVDKGGRLVGLRIDAQTPTRQEKPGHGNNVS
ncbi:hypothetical protein [Micromonospora sp. IBSANI012]|uniref:hypothetical protein n=1 Tax=Micromonospora sp. IBSANI012 TaxID=3457761 RepID=UPI00405936EF